MKLEPANISFDAQGQPFAKDFDDVYFSQDKGVEESNYVFIAGNDLISKWRESKSPSFCIGETGFGTGLNLLLSAHTFLTLQDMQATSIKRLHMLTTEKYPLSKEQLIRAHQNWPKLSGLSQELVKAYPIAIQGLHRIELAGGRIIIDLLLGDAAEMLSSLYVPQHGLVDAWFLDGFAPSKNGSMWHAALFEQIALLSKAEASLATFTAAGAVKRALQASGFIVNKRKGFGRKREMIVAQNQNTQRRINYQQQAPYFARPSAAHKARKVAIIGAGLAGAICAHKLSQLGVQLDLFCTGETVADGASGNAQGGIYPQLNAELNINSEVQIASFLYARRYYDGLAAMGADFAHQWCGALLLAFNPNVASRQQKLISKAQYPEALVSGVDAIQASKLANVDVHHSALWFPLAGWISPPQLVTNLLAIAKSSTCLNLHTGTTVSDIQHTSQHATISVNGEVLKYDYVILASGANTPNLLQQTHDFRLTRGQVESVPSTQTSQNLSTLLCHKGYFTPAMQGQHAMGSTYVKNDVDTRYRDSEASDNLHMHRKSMGQHQWMDELILCDRTLADKFKGRAAIRCSTPDHLPLVGQVPDLAQQAIDLANLYQAKPAQHYTLSQTSRRVYVLSGLGSRGLTTAPILAETLISEMCGKALPLPTKLLNALAPNRFLVRKLIRRQDPFS